VFFLFTYLIYPYFSVITVTLECWDADIISSDDFLGKIELDLSKMIKGARTSKSCRIAMLQNKKRSKANLFNLRNHRGWWPFVSVESNNYKLAVCFYFFFNRAFRNDFYRIFIQRESSKRNSCCSQKNKRLKTRLDLDESSQTPYQSPSNYFLIGFR